MIWVVISTDLNARYEKQQLAMLFSLLDAEFQPSDLIAKLLGEIDSAALAQVGLGTPVNNIEYFTPNFEGLVLGCIDADFCK